MCNIEYRINKVKKYIHQIASAYLVADSNLAILKPLVYDEIFIQRFNNTLAANGLERLQETLLLALIERIVNMIQDTDPRTASLFNVVKLIEDKQLKTALEEQFCKEENRKKEFEDKYQKIKEDTDNLIKSELGQKLRKVRDKIISHYEMTLEVKELRPFKPNDFGLNWGDTEKYMSEAEPIIFDSVYLINRGFYYLEDFKKSHTKISQEFWKTCQLINN